MVPLGNRASKFFPEAIPYPLTTSAFTLFSFKNFPDRFELRTEALKESIASAFSTNFHPYWMHTAWTVPDISISFFISVNTTIGPALYIMNSQEWSFILIREFRALGRGWVHASSIFIFQLFNQTIHFLTDDIGLDAYAILAFNYLRNPALYSLFYKLKFFIRIRVAR